MAKKDWPDWVAKFRTTGTEVQQKGDKFYLYEVTSKYDPEKKRAKKVTGKYLGAIRPEGVIPPKHERVAKELENISVKECGASSFVLENSKDVIEKVKQIYPVEWKEIIVTAIQRLFHASPLKNIGIHYQSSYLSEMIPGAKVSPKTLSSLLMSLGRRRKQSVEFMKQFVTGNDFEIIDLTHIFSKSENVISATLGRNAEGEYVPQLNLCLVFSKNENRPAFYRLVPGCIRDVSIIPLTMSEAGIKKAVLVGDKAFYSEANITALIKEGVEYIFPLKRNSALIDYSLLKNADKKLFGGYFKFDERVIWYYERSISSDQRIVTFLDERLRVEEEQSFLTLVESQKRTMEEYFERQHMFGTITVATNTAFSASEIYEHLKARLEVEQFFDTFKNVLNADRTYLRTDTQIEGWMLINFISMLFYYDLYGLLLRNKLLNKYSPMDVILHLSRIQALFRIDGWVLSEIPKTARVLLKKMGGKIDITQIRRS